MLTIDKLKIFFAAAAAVAGILLFITLESAPLVVKLLGVLAGFGIGAVIAYTSDPGKRFYEYTQESVAETKKVVWPTRKETVQTTGIVVAFVFVMALFLWLVDGLLGIIVRFLLGTGD